MNESQRTRRNWEWPVSANIPMHRVRPADEDSNHSGAGMKSWLTLKRTDWRSKLVWNDSLILVPGMFSFNLLKLKSDSPHSWPRFVNSGFGAQVAILFLVHLPIVDIFPARAALSTRKSALFVKRPTMAHLIRCLEAFYSFQMTLILFPTLCYICFKARWCILLRVVWS